MVVGLAATSALGRLAGSGWAAFESAFTKRVAVLSTTPEFRPRWPFACAPSRFKHTILWLHSETGWQGTASDVRATGGLVHSLLSRTRAIAPRFEILRGTKNSQRPYMHAGWRRCGLCAA